MKAFMQQNIRPDIPGELTLHVRFAFISLRFRRRMNLDTRGPEKIGKANTFAKFAVCKRDVSVTIFRDVVDRQNESKGSIPLICSHWCQNKRLTLSWI